MDLARPVYCRALKIAVVRELKPDLPGVSCQPNSFDDRCGFWGQCWRDRAEVSGRSLFAMELARGVAGQGRSGISWTGLSWRVYGSSDALSGRWRVGDLSHITRQRLIKSVHPASTCGSRDAYETR
jgi:hypothetical protein